MEFLFYNELMGPTPIGTYKFRCMACGVELPVMDLPLVTGQGNALTIVTCDGCLAGLRRALDPVIKSVRKRKKK